MIDFRERGTIAPVCAGILCSGKAYYVYNILSHLVKELSIKEITMPRLAF